MELSLLVMMLLAGCSSGGDSGGGGGGSAAPVAQASADQTVPVGTPATLDGSASDSPSGAPLSYQWTLTAKPAGSIGLLEHPQLRAGHLHPRCGRPVYRVSGGPGERRGEPT